MIKVRKENITYRIYDESKVQEFLIDGFVIVKPKKKTESVMLDEDEEPTLAELKKMADELEIEYPSNITYAKLLQKINAKKAEQ